MRVLILGGAGFVGSSLARYFKESDECKEVTCFDNLKRRGSEINLRDFRKRSINFIHGDVRNPNDLNDIDDNFDIVIEACAEPSVHAGQSGKGLDYLIGTNLSGTINFLEFLRKRSGAGVFLSTSRVYSISALKELPLTEDQDRFRLDSNSPLDTGISENGVSESFPMVSKGFRSFYGSTKLASELFIEEYAQSFDLPVIINRCGVIAGSGQFGKTDQGVFTLWVARHLWGGDLSYTGFGGKGKQVRDLLHPEDLFALIQKQIPVINSHRGAAFSVGGGTEGAVSLKEYSEICAAVTGNQLDIKAQKDTASVDIPWFITDHSKARKAFDWTPQWSPENIAKDINDWLKSTTLEKHVKELFQ